MFHVDLGNVPSWLAAGSLSIAFAILVRDRRNADREQVDRVGIWFTETYDRRPPGADRVEEAAVEVRLRNASDLPVEVVKLAYEVRTRWLVPAGELAYIFTDGSAPLVQLLENVRIPPGETLSAPSPVNVAHLAPEGAVQIAPIGGVTCAVDWFFVIDNAGRRWRARPRRERAKRWRWYRRPGEHQPRKW
jgi:hypothetical protein